MKRKTIAVDIDDVLAASAEGFAEFSNKQWGMNISAADYDENWAKAWGLPLEKAVKFADDFHALGAFGQYRYIEHAVPVLKKLSARYKLIVVTSRRKILKPETDTWIERHFPAIFEELHYAGIYDSVDDHLHALKQHKAGLCRELGADYLIDDQLKHCFAAAECGMQALLFGRYNWNEVKAPLPKNVVRVSNWDEVEEYFDAAR
jgi:uncharacterized HAD superfamily protein